MARHALFIIGILMVLGRLYLPLFGLSGSLLIVEPFIGSFVLYYGLMDELMNDFGIRFSAAFTLSSIATFVVLAVIVLA